MDAAEQLIRELIQERGPISFARFMEIALFSPQGGYYSSRQHLDARGDYFTSPAAHPLFGALIASQLQQMWELLQRPDPFTVVELGAGSGLLGREVLASHPLLDPAFCSALRYVAIDRFVPPEVSCSKAASNPKPLVAQGIPLRNVVGCILSNELLDAFPVHRFQVWEGRIHEVYVALQDGELVEALGEPSTPEIAHRVRGATRTPLCEGFQGEICLLLEPWMAEVVQALQRGFVLTIDYGGTALELYGAHRGQGTLRCYYQHTLNANPYVRIGRQDITAHVDFSALMSLGERYGFPTQGYSSQREFLSNLGAQAFLETLDRRARRPEGRRNLPSSRETPFPETPGALGDRMSQGPYFANRMAIEELLRPEGMGGFRVLVQGCNVEMPSLWGFQPENPWLQKLLAQRSSLEVPLLAEEHTPLLEGRYPHHSFDPGALWPWGPDARGPGTRPQDGSS